MQTVNMTFIHDGNNWIARDGTIEVSGKDLGQLDSRLREAIGKAYRPVKGTRLAVKLDFDYSTIPYWMTQYHPYYMHRRLEFDY